MNNNTMKVLFLLSKNRTNKMGKCTLKCRITYLKERREFSTGQFINPNNWISKQQLVKTSESDAELINTQLSLIKSKINNAFLLLQIQKNSYTVEDIYRLYKGEKLVKDYTM